MDKYFCPECGYQGNEPLCPVCGIAAESLDINEEDLITNSKTKYPEQLLNKENDLLEDTDTADDFGGNVHKQI